MMESDNMAIYFQTCWRFVLSFLVKFVVKKCVKVQWSCRKISGKSFSIICISYYDKNLMLLVINVLLILWHMFTGIEYLLGWGGKVARNCGKIHHDVCKIIDRVYCIGLIVRVDGSSCDFHPLLLSPTVLTHNFYAQTKWSMWHNNCDMFPLP